LSVLQASKWHSSVNFSRDWLNRKHWVSKVLGHTRVWITLDIYRHVLELGKRQQVVGLFEMPVPKRFVEHIPLN
jgi:integrase